MNKKRLYLFMAAIQYAAVIFAQHPYSSGGNPLCWALVGAIGAIFSYLVYFGFSLVAAYINRKLKRIKNSDTKEQINKVEIEITEQTEKEQSNEINSKFCRFCGENIEEDAIFCSHCGKKVHSSGSQKTALLDFSKSMINKIWNWLCIPFSYIKINVKSIKVNRLGKKIIVAIITIFTFLFLSVLCRNMYLYYYLPYKYKALYKEGMSNVDKANEIALELYNYYPYYNNNKCIDVLTNSAEKGNVESMVLLGRFYKGYGMKVGHDEDWTNKYKIQDNLAKSSYWYLQAAKKGNAEAQGELGHNYKYGIGIQQDFDKAIYWTKQGADNGDAVAQWRMGNLYLSGLAYYMGENYIWWYVGENTFKAKDDPDKTLGRNYLNYMKNKEPEQVFLYPDIKKAKYYWKLAANQGLKEAKGALEKVYEGDD